MDNFMADKSFSDSEKTPPTFISNRIKRKREEDFSHEFSKFKDEMKSMISTLMLTQEQEISKFNANLKDIKQTSINIENSIAFLTAQNLEFKNKIEQLEGKLNEDRKYITVLEDKIESMQMDSKKSNFEIKNVPRKPNETKEDLIQMITHLSSTIGSQIKKENIKDIYRLRDKKGTNLNTPIIVETSSTLLKNEVLKLCKAFNIKQKPKLCAKHLGLRDHEYTPVFISEQLTARAARLYFLARDLTKAKLFKYCWTAYGRVYLRKDDDSPIIHVGSEVQLVDLKKSK